MTAALGILAAVMLIAYPFLLVDCACRGIRKGIQRGPEKAPWATGCTLPDEQNDA